MPEDVQSAFHELRKSTLNRSNTVTFLEIENDSLRRVIKVLCGALGLVLVFGGLIGGALF